jgi:predicted glycosyltransferase
MRILIDINHPAHVHYFRNFIKIMVKKVMNL